MDIYGQVWQLVEETVTDLRNNPSLLEEFIEELEEYNEELPDEGKIGLDLEQSWAGITALLQRVSKLPEAKFIVEFGEPVRDLEYGSARLISPATVKKLSTFVSAWSFDQLIKGQSVQKFEAAERYPFKEGQSDKESFEYLKPHYEKLVEFLERTSDMGRWLLAYLY